MAPFTETLTVTIEDTAALNNAAITLANRGIKGLVSGTTERSSQTELQFQVRIKETTCGATLQSMGNDHEGVLRGTAEATYLTSPVSYKRYLLEVIRTNNDWTTIVRDVMSYGYDD